MAFEDINSEAAIWKSAGIKYIFYPDGLPKIASRSNNAPRQTAETEIGARRKFAPASRPPRPGTTQPARPPVSQRQAAGGASPSFLAPEAMGDEWRSLLARTKKGLVAWTYPELGADFSSSVGVAPDAEKAGFAARRGFISRILKDLNHPPGTHAFLPLAPGVWNPDNFSAAHFFSALKILNCRGLLIFGSNAGQILFPGRKLRPLFSWMHGNLFVWVLRDINVLSEPDSPRYNESLAYLREALSRFARR